MTWQARALCDGADTDLFFADDLTEARRICGACPVRDACRGDIMARESGKGLLMRYGFQGGMTPQERYDTDPLSAGYARPTDEARRMRQQLYRAGCTDEEIADRTGIPADQVMRWRIQMRLSPHVTDEQRKALWDQGLSDQQIADALGVERTSVQRWRISSGLPSHFKPSADGCKRGHPRTPENTRWGRYARCRVCERERKAEFRLERRGA